MIIKNNKNKLIRHQAATCFFVLLLVGSFFVGSSTKAALLGNYNKATSSTLRADEWNNLFKDFLSTIGGVVSGAVGINTPTSSSYILDVNGSIRGTTITGSYLGTLNAANVSSGQFGANIGGGNFSFPGNVGVGVTNPLTKIDVSGGAIRTDGQFISTVGYGTAPLSVISTTTVANLSANYLGFGSVGATPSISPYSKLTAGIITLPEFSNSEAGTITVRGWNSSYYSWQIIGNNTPWNRPDLYFRTGPDGSWGTTYKLWHSGNLTSGLATSSVVKWNGSSLANSLIYDNGTALGVGTTNPSTKLDIVGNTGDEYLTIRSLATSSNSGIILKGRNSGIDYQAKIYSNWVGGLVFLPSTGNPIVEFFNNATANTANTIGFRFNALNSVSGAKTYASIIGQTTGITSGSENGAILFNTISTGTLAEKMRIDNIGNVGIGVTNPLGQLHVASNITGTAANFIVEHTQTGVGMQAAYIDAKAENELYFRGFQGAVQKFQFGYNSNMGDVVGIGYGTGNNIIINSLGNIGINTTTPNAKLQIFGGTGVVLNASDGRISGVGDPATSTDAVNLKYLTDNYSPSANSLWATGATGIYNVGLGNVGIGTTNPQGNLEVYGNNSGKDNNIFKFSVGSNNTPFSAVDFQIGSPASSWAGIRFSNPASNVTNLELSNWNGSARTVRMGIYGTSGLVGIGTTTPVAKLDVIGNMFSNNLYLSSYRNLGGYGAPIETSSGTKARIIFGAQSSDSAEISSELDASLNTGLVFSIKDDPSDYFDFRNQSNSVLRIMNGGNIGIGTTTLDARLKVVTPTGTGNAINTAGGVITGLGSPSLDTDAVPLKYLNDNFMPAGTTIKSVYIASTVASSTGNNSGHPGYEYANGLCNVASPGSHVCTPDEMLNTISAGLGDRIATSTIGIWIFNGPPGFTANAMDCSGRTVGMVGTGFDDYGTIWVKPTGSGHGYGSLAFCKDSYKFACCK